MDDDFRNNGNLSFSSKLSANQKRALAEQQSRWGAFSGDPSTGVAGAEGTQSGPAIQDLWARQLMQKFLGAFGGSGQ